MLLARWNCAVGFELYFFYIDDFLVEGRYGAGAVCCLKFVELVVLTVVSLAYVGAVSRRSLLFFRKGTHGARENVAGEVYLVEGRERMELGKVLLERKKLWLSDHIVDVEVELLRS